MRRRRGSKRRPPRPVHPYCGDPCQEAPCFPPGYPGFLGFRWFRYGKRDLPTPNIHERPGVSGL
eukprot:8992692-Pyramimonas_sp.AAC.1